MSSPGWRDGDSPAGGLRRRAAPAALAPDRRLVPVIVLVLVLVLLLPLAGCGQMGPLTLPGATETTGNASASASAASASAANAANAGATNTGVASSTAADDTDASDEDGAENER